MAYQEPLKYWREHEMPKVTRNPTALLAEDGELVQVGDILPVTEAVSHGSVTRKVKLQSVIPDSDGLVDVTETYRIDPAKIGLKVRPATVILELSLGEAAAVIEFYNKQQQQGVAVLDELQNTMTLEGRPHD